MSQFIRTCARMPRVSDFAAGDGTPIVIDVTTGIGYYLYKNIVMQLVGGELLVNNAFSNGFSDGFANGP